MRENSKMTRFIVSELDTQLQRAALAYIRYGTGRSRLVRLQELRRQYRDASGVDAISRDTEQVVSTPPLAA